MVHAEQTSCFPNCVLPTTDDSSLSKRASIYNFHVNTNKTT